MKNIQIENRCHEKWTEMTPTEQGAFCSKCAVDVHDFTNKSLFEIKQTLLLNKGGMCGRIENKQLEQLNTDFLAWKSQNTRSFQSRFVYALLVVFGLGLFSCSKDEAKVIDQMTKTELFADKYDSEEAVRIKENIEPLQIAIDESVELIPELDLDLVLAEVNVVDESIETERTVMVLGGMGWSDHYNEYLVETVAYQIDSIETKRVESQETIDKNNAPKFESKVFPNPTMDYTTLDLKVVRPEQYEIAIYNLNGQKVYTIHSGLIDEGERRFTIDLSDLESGNYLIVILSETEKETLKIQKIK